jgi:hypothetical protein
MLKLQWGGYVLTPGSGYFTPNHNSQTTTSHRKADYTIVSTTFHSIWMFFEYQYILYKKGMGGMDFMKGGRDKPRCFQIFCLIFMFCEAPKKEQMTALWKIYMSRVHNTSKCHFHSHVTKQRNPLQVDNLIKNKRVAILEASRRTLDT